jgi:hypothetical protein
VDDLFGGVCASSPSHVGENADMLVLGLFVASALAALTFTG